MVAEAYTIRYRYTIKISKKSKKPYLDTKKLTLYKKCYDEIVLENASKKVKWSTSNKKIVRLKKKGNRVEVHWKKKGKCTVRARYKGKTYKCKITCKGVCPNAVALDYNSHYTCVGTSDPILIRCYTDNTILYSDEEDPSIVSCEWGEWEWDDDLYEWKIELYLKALKPGKTRVLITNSHNKRERDYITVEVVT